jgi:DNA-binding HxlR family transcriptional regulator
MATPMSSGIRRFDCPVAGFQLMISGKYKLRLLWDLRDGPRRYGELKRTLSDTTGLRPVTARVLSRELKALTQLGLIERKDFKAVPPKVEYRLSPVGRSLLPVIKVMHRWGVKNLVREEVLKRMGVKPVNA